MTERQSPEVSCTNCGACCRAGGLLALSDDEARFLAEGQTDLTVIFPAKRRELMQALVAGRTSASPGEQLLINFMKNVPPGKGAYLLNADCGYLDENAQCAVYTDPRRPQKCEEFETGSQACRAMRVARGVDRGPVSLPMPTIRRTSPPHQAQ